MHRGFYLPTVSHATRPCHARCRCSPGGGPGGGGCAGVLLSGTSGDTSPALQGSKSGEAGLVKGLLRPMYCPMHCPQNGECGPRLCRTVCYSQTRTASRLPSPLYTTAHHHCYNCTNRSWNRSSVPGSGPLCTSANGQIRHVALQQLLCRSAPRKSPGHVFKGG